MFVMRVATDAEIVKCVKELVETLTVDGRKPRLFDVVGFAMVRYSDCDEIVVNASALVKAIREAGCD